uniref:Auxin-responsive protein SAUR32-like n=1 Tax=Elaeis guineensis var. tenera TaxID=51953 RepID=A0A6I9R8I0_ELAGV|nr:auxin-responsive protein SAUR32-like [Elaeis guineensis]
MKSEDKDHHHHPHHRHNRLFNFHLHMRHEKGASSPKGLMGIRVGMEGEEEQQRFMVPVEYLKHPLFVGLLNEAEREYGFDQPAAITIPCRVDYFRYVLSIIDRDSSAGQTHHRQHHRLAHFAGCFRA